MKDFNYESLHQKVRPLVLHLGRVTQPASIFTMRVKSTALLNSTRYIEDSWDKFSRGEKCYLLFLDQHLKQMYDSEKKTGSIILIFSFIAVLIASLGLFGLTAFVTEQKTKEIGIRKVLGASVPDILVHISRQYVILIILGNCLSWPVAWLIIHKWFSGFAYHTSISIYIFAGSSLLIFFIAIATICLQAFRAANADPVSSLRTE